MASTNNYKNRWLDFVFEIDKRKGKEITRFWINEKLIGVINGDLSPQGKFLGFKFGPIGFRSRSHHKMKLFITRILCGGIHVRN